MSVLRFWLSVLHILYLRMYQHTHTYIRTYVHTYVISVLKCVYMFMLTIHIILCLVRTYVRVLG